MDLLLRSEKDPKEIAQKVLDKAVQVEFILKKWRELVVICDGDIGLAKKTVFYYQHILDEGFANVPNNNLSLEHGWREVATQWGISGKADIRNFGTNFISESALYQQLMHNPCLIDSGAKWADTFHCEHTVGNQKKVLEHLNEWLNDPLVPSPKEMATQALIGTVACTILMSEKGKVQGSENHDLRHPFHRYAEKLRQRVFCFSNGTVKDASGWSLSQISHAIMTDSFTGEVYNAIENITEEEVDAKRTEEVISHAKRKSYHQIPDDLTVFIKMNPFELEDHHYTHHLYKTYDPTSKKYYSKTWNDARVEWKKTGTIPTALWDKDGLFYPK
jgi:hypothetical protein